MTLQLQSASSTPVTATSSLSVNVASNSSGEFVINPSSFVMPTGMSQTIVNYTDDKAASITLTASAALPVPSASSGVSIAPGPYSQLQILFPGQVSDPGRPTADASGHVGGVGQIVADNPVNVTVNAVDAYFNPVTFNGAITLTSTDNTPEDPVTLVSGTASGPVQFYNAGTPRIGGIDPFSSAVTWFSDQATVLGAASSPDLNLVHASPNISDVILGQTNLTIFTFNMQVPVGQQTILVSSLTVHATDQSGADVPVNSAFTTLGLSYAGGAFPLNVTGNSSALAALNAPISVTGTVLPVTLFADVAPTVTAQTLKFSIANSAAITANDVPSGTVSISTVGDPTGFPMVSGVMVFTDGELAKTYGNYPNPFHAGSEPTTIEFNLQTASTVSLEIYDVMGNRVRSLLKNAALPAGIQRVPWDGENGMGSLVLNGIYFAQLDVNGAKLLLKIAVVK